jgi:hypothetical protein
MTAGTGHSMTLEEQRAKIIGEHRPHRQIDAADDDDETIPSTTKPISPACGAIGEAAAERSPGSTGSG